MKFAIYGAGSLGIVFAAYLAKAGEKFDVIDIDKATVNDLNKKGATVTGKANFTAKVNALLSNDVKEKYDIVFLITKQLGNDQIVKNIAKSLNKDGVICTFQNGLPEAGIAEIIGEKRTYGAAIGWGATKIAPAVSELTSEAEKSCLTFSLGSLDGHRDEKFDEIVRLFNIMGTTEIEENFIGARYVKLIINSAFSGMSTVCGATFGEVAKNKASRKVIQRIIKECIDVADAAGIKPEKIQGKDVVKLLNYKGKFKKMISFMIIPLAIKKHAILKASMLQDIEKGRACEIDSINGTVCALGDKYAVDTKFNDKVVEIIKKFETKELSPSFENVKLFENLF